MKQLFLFFALILISTSCSSLDLGSKQTKVKKGKKNSEVRYARFDR